MQMIGEVEHVDFIEKHGNNGKYYMAFVHLKNWFQNMATINLRDKIERGEEGRIVYDEPYYWAIYKNRNPTNPNDTEKKLQCAMLMIEDLQHRVWELEKLAIENIMPPPPPPPRLIRQNAEDRGDIIRSSHPFPSIHPW